MLVLSALAAKLLTLPRLLNFFVDSGKFCIGLAMGRKPRNRPDILVQSVSEAGEAIEETKTWQEHFAGILSMVCRNVGAE